MWRWYKWIGTLLLVIACGLPVQAQQANVYWLCTTGIQPYCPVSAANPLPITGSVSLTFPTIGAAVPATGIYSGINVAGTLRGVTGLGLGSTFSPTIAIVDASGNQITTFGGGTFNNNSDNVATSATNGQNAAWLYVWDGAAWDRLYGDSTNGAKVQVTNTNANLATNADAIAAVAANAAGAGSPVNSAGYVYNGTTWDRMPGTTAGVTVRSPTAANFLATTTPSPPASGAALTGNSCGSAVSSCVLKASAGNFYGAYAECTSACWLMVFNAASAPSNGATTAGIGSGNLVECIDIAAASSKSINYPTFPRAFSVGITVAISSTACATLTLSTVGFVSGTVM